MSAARRLARRCARPSFALLGGFLVALSLPPWGVWPLAPIGVAVFAIAVGDEPSVRRRAGLGFTFAAAWLSMGMGWMWFLTVPGYLITIALFAGLHAAAAAIVPTGRWQVIAQPAAHTLAEIVRLWFPFGGIPLATLGISQASGPLLQVAGLGGVILITWIVFQVGFALASIVEARAATPRVIGALAVVAFVIALAAVAPDGHDVDGATIDVAAVQGGGEQGTRALDVPSSEVTRAHLRATATIPDDAGVDLVVWPENAIDVNGVPFAASDVRQAIAAEAARLDAPFAVGITIDSEFSAYPSEGAFVNAQVVVAPDGEVSSTYEKVRIVPFGEYVPFRGVLETLGAPLDQIPSDAVAGRDPAVIVLPDGTELGVMISWEVFFGNRGRDAADGALLLNPTNGASYTGTVLQTQQVASSQLRAAETGRWVVQVAPTGFSAFVSNDGEVFDRTDVGEQTVIAMPVPLRSGTTWYTSLGDLPWIAAVVLTLVLTLLRSRGGG